MRNAIQEYIELTEAEKEELWKSATFVFDTNVLLNLYRYTTKTRESLLRALEDLKDRIWIPHHVAEEFMKDRCTVILEHNSVFTEIRKSKDAFINECSQKLRLKAGDAEIQELGNAIEQWVEKIEEQNPSVHDFTNDEVLEKILSLFDGKVGEGFGPEKITTIEKEGQGRYANQVPPGYKDANKNKVGKGNAYGDLIIWREILRFAGENEKDIIFVTGDQKEDWWYIIKSRTIGPRFELRKEFYKETGNRRFHMYTMERFLSIYSDSKGEPIDTSVIEEIGMVAMEREKTEGTLYSGPDNKNASTEGQIIELEKQLVNMYDKNGKRMNAIKLLQGQIKNGAGNPEEKLVEIRNIEDNIRRTEKEIDRIRREIMVIKTRRGRRQILLEEELESVIGR